MPSQNKTRIEQENDPNAQLIKMLSGYVPDTDVKELMKFLFEDIPDMKFFQPDGNPKDEWELFSGETWGDACDAARKITYSRAWNAEWNKAWNAVWDVSPDGKKELILDKIRTVAMDAVRDRTNGAAPTAEWDAALMATYLLSNSWNTENREAHLAYVLERWNVWQKGYGALCDLDGVLYVYFEMPKTPNKLERIDKDSAEKPINLRTLKDGM